MDRRLSFYLALSTLILSCLLPLAAFGQSPGTITNTFEAGPCTVDDKVGRLTAATFVPERFRATEDGKSLLADGKLTATCLVLENNQTRTITDHPITDVPVQVPPPQGTGALRRELQVFCDVLDLRLGPLHLDLLGLIIDLNAIHLQIRAQPGPGNLLGNLLCAVANLLNGGGLLSQIADLLNRILGILGLLG